MSLSGPHCILQQRSNKPLDNPGVDALHTGTDSSRSPSTELEPAPRDSRAFITKRPENSPEISETPVIALGKMRHEKDDHSGDGNPPSHAYGRWSTAANRTWMRSITEGARTTVHLYLLRVLLGPKIRSRTRRQMQVSDIPPVAKCASRSYKWKGVAAQSPGLTIVGTQKKLARVGPYMSKR